LATFGDRVFDYVIVGGGSAGCALAARLSERPGNDVLLVEAGEDYPPGEEPPELKDSFAATAHSNPRFTWTGLTAAFLPRGNQPDRRPRRRYTQGRVMGGGSSVNGMVAIRGLPSDYDNWAAQGAVGWDWEGVLPAFRKLESDQDFDGPMHGSGGPVGLRRVPEDRWPGFVRAVIAAFEDAGFKRHPDQNAIFEDGVYPIAISNINDQRVSTAMAYLTPEVRARKNFTVLSEAHAERLQFDGNRVTGLRVARQGETVEIAARETIVSSGAIHSPALLLRSGIGPAAELSALGIGVIADRPGVGKHLMEHPGVNFGVYMRRGARLPSDLRRQMFAGLRYSSGMDGCPSADMYMIPTNKAAWHAVGERLGLTMLWVNHSYSTGEVRLTSPDPRAEPDVDFDMCSDRRDMDRLIAGTKMMAKLHEHAAVRDVALDIFPVSYSDRARKVAVYSRFNKFQTWLGGQLMDLSGPARRWMIRNLIADGPSMEDLAADDRAIEDWIRATVLGHWHASCTCRMGAPDDPRAVTDPSARVYGVSGLRVCDASIMPHVPSANTNIPTIMVGEKVASIMLAE